MSLGSGLAFIGGSTGVLLFIYSMRIVKIMQQRQVGSVKRQCAQGGYKELQETVLFGF
jgi:hypothetical protein